MSILYLIAGRNFISVNRDLIESFGLDVAILLGELASEYEYHYKNGTLDDGCFYSTVANIQSNTGLSAHQQRQAFQMLIDNGMVTIQKRGIPAKRYIQINEEQVVKIFNDKWLKNCTTGSEKIEPQDAQKFNGNNNIEKRNKNKNKHKYGEFQNVLLTDEEYAKVKEKGLLGMLEELSVGIESKGYKYQSHYATILSWQRKRDKEEAERRMKSGKLKSKPTFDLEEIKRRGDLGLDLENFEP